MQESCRLTTEQQRVPVEDGAADVTDVNLGCLLSKAFWCGHAEKGSIGSSTGTGAAVNVEAPSPVPRSIGLHVLSATVANIATTRASYQIWPHR